MTTLINLISDGYTVIVDGHEWRMPRINANHKLDAQGAAIIALAHNIHVQNNQWPERFEIRGEFDTRRFLIEHGLLVEYLASRTTEPFEKSFYNCDRLNGHELLHYFERTQEILNGIVNGDFSPIDYLLIFAYFDDDIDFEALMKGVSE